MSLPLRLAALLVLATAAGAQQTPIAFTGAHLIPVDGPEIESGTLLVHEGKIVAIGASVAIPSGAERVDASGKTIMPGLVDTHSHAGQVEGADRSAPMQAGVRTLDSINVRHSGIQKAQAGGITTANIMSGSGHLLSGQTTYVKYRDGKTIDELLLYNADGSVAGGIKMANGTNSRRDPPFPGTRAKSAAIVREQFVKAQEYAAKIEAAGDDESKRPERDLGLEALGEVLVGKRVVHHHTHRHDDILTVLRLAEEFGFQVVLQHASDARFVAQEIAAAGVPASILLLDSPGGKIEAKHVAFETARALEDAGVLIGFHTDDSITDSRLFLRQGGLAIRAGMSRQGAIYGLTMAGARMLRLEDRVGSLAPGKDADFVILSGEPLSIYTQVLETWIDGERVFDRSDPADRLYAEGGWGASHDQTTAAHDLAGEGH